MDRPSKEVDNVLCPDLLLYVGRVEGIGEQDVIGALGGAGMQIRHVRTADEAAACVRFLPVRMLVVGLDGPEDAWRLIRRTADTGREIPIVCLSATATRSRVLGAIRRGAKGYLVAPITEIQCRQALIPLLGGALPQDEPSISPGGSIEELAS